MWLLNCVVCLRVTCQRAGAPLMEAVSRHLEHFSAGLFEEIMRFPYHVSGGSAKGSGKPDTSHNVRLEKRRLRLVHIRDQTLEYR